MTTSGTNASPEYALPHQPDSAPPLRRPSLAAWIAIGLAANASLILVFHLAIHAAIPDSRSWWPVTASIAAFAAVPWLVHRTLLPWLLVALPASQWERVSHLAFVVPYAAVSTVTAQTAGFTTFFVTASFMGEIIVQIVDLFSGPITFPAPPGSDRPIWIIFVAICSAMGGAMCGLLFQFRHALPANLTGPPVRLRTDVLGGAIAGAIGSSVLLLVFGKYYQPDRSSYAALAMTPLESAICLVATGTLALLPHLILTGRDARAIPAASRS